MSTIMNIFKPLIDFIYPPVCEVCGKRLYREKVVCNDCLSQIAPIIPPLCEKTGRPSEYVSCKNSLRYIDKIRAYASFSSPMKEIIYLFKYKGRLSLAKRLSTLLHISFLNYYKNEKIDYIIPVPLHRVKLRERGYNQSLILSRELSKSVGIPIIEPIQRIRNTPSQTGLSPLKRLKNVESAFRLKEKIEGTILLIDDVTTTGATFDNCAKALKEGGTLRTLGLALALAL